LEEKKEMMKYMKKKSLFTQAVLLSAFFVTGAVQAQEKVAAVPMLGEGTKELTLQGFADFEASDEYYYFLDLGYGKFWRDGLEVGVNVGLTSTDSSTQLSIGPFFEYNFSRKTPFVPYIHFGLLWANADLEVGSGDNLVDTSSDALLLDGEAGVKYFLVDNVAISTGLSYEWATDKIFDAGDTAKDGNALLKLGMRFYF
jgi:hypothetical protein